MSTSERFPLHVAAMSDDAPLVEALLDDDESPDLADERGFTPLHLAAQEYAVSAAAALLAGNAQVDPENSLGNTPLFVAVFNSKGRGGMIRLLRSHGADPLHANLSNQTPAGLAKLIDNFDVEQYFTDVSE